MRPLVYNAHCITDLHIKIRRFVPGKLNGQDKLQIESDISLSLICSGSDVVSVSCFGVRVSVMFHFMFVHYTFSSVWVAEWPPFGK